MENKSIFCIIFFDINLLIENDNKSLYVVTKVRLRNISIYFLKMRFIPHKTQQRWKKKRKKRKNNKKKKETQVYKKNDSKEPEG